jgi:polar amino acid transport system substrate-binding protein
MRHLSAQSLLEIIQARGSIRIAAQWELTAEQYLDPDTGEPAGVVGKVGTLLAIDLGVRPDFVGLTWDEQIPALLDGRVDICLKHTNTPRRAFMVDFVRGRLEKYVGKIVVRRARDWQAESELDEPDKVIGAIAGSHQEAQARLRYPNARVRLFRTEHEGMEAVNRGEADACLGDAWVANYLLLRPECEVLSDDSGEPVITSLDYGHPCIRKGDPSFLNWLDNWMDYHDVQGSFERAIADAYREHEAKIKTILATFLQGLAPA